MTASGQAMTSARALAGLLPSAGVADTHAELVAIGLLTRWHYHCWQNFTDVFGSEDEAESAGGWVSRSGIIVPLAEKAGVLVVVHAMICCPTALGTAPQSVRKTWMRWHRESYDEGIQRQELAHGSRKALKMATTEAVDQAEVIPQSLNLFGESNEQVTTPKRPPPKHTPKHEAFIKHFCACYARKYGRDYIFRGTRDGKTVKTLLAAVTLTNLKIATSRYLASNDPFYAGHDLGRFGSDINRFLDSGPNIGVEGGRDLPRIK